MAVIGEIPRLGAVFPEGESAAPYLSRRLPRSLRGWKCEKPGAHLAGLLLGLLPEVLGYPATLDSPPIFTIIRSASSMLSRRTMPLRMA